MSPASKSQLRRTITAVLLWMSTTAFGLAGDILAGTVRNGSTGQIVAGEDVVLLRLGNGMEEEARAKTSAQGTFSFNVKDPSRRYVIRVVHQAVNYDQMAAGSNVGITIFDAAPKVHGLRGFMELMRIGAIKNSLHVSDMYDIQNKSVPPVTQSGERSFEVYLPAKARIDSVLAAGPESIPLKIAATPVKGEPGHFTISFPLRPGETKFGVNYNLPYDGHVAFHPRMIYPQQQLAVMVPSTMAFTSNSPRFHALVKEGDVRVQIVSDIKAGEVLGFEVSGTGAVPGLSPPTKLPSQSRSQVATAGAPEQAAKSADSTVVHPSAASPVPSSRGKSSSVQSPFESSQSSDASHWILPQIIGVVVFLVCGGLTAWRMRKPSMAEPAGMDTMVRSRSPMESLKEELFRLETTRLRGSISPEEYAATRQVLERSVERALAASAKQSS